MGRFRENYFVEARSVGFSKNVFEFINVGRSLYISDSLNGIVEVEGVLPSNWCDFHYFISWFILESLYSTVNGIC